ncbi:MAG: TetR/AcrR family transcriptional regulator [Ardenticatenaceae bacterium]|nr:TetR/AcrR family transcriptional regulator [Ardenticatenaceae bacterium]
MDHLPQNETRERIMDTAETLFMTRGYKAVRLRDIADAVGMRHASLYYYVPKGKEQLFVAVVERSLARHEREMTRLIREAGDDFRAQAYAVSDWLSSQPPIDLVRMTESDLPEINPAKAAELSSHLLMSLTKPIINAMHQAIDQGWLGIDRRDVGLSAMSLITLVQSVHHIPTDNIPDGRQVFGRRLADLLLEGLLAR